MTHKEKLEHVARYIQHEYDCKFRLQWPTCPIYQEIESYLAWERSRCSCGAVQARTLLQEVIEALP